jgi:hypothetical protein
MWYDSDIGTVRGTVGVTNTTALATLTGQDSVEIDWSKGNTFTHTLTGPTKYYFKNEPDAAGSIDMILTNVGSRVNIGERVFQYRHDMSGGSYPTNVYYVYGMTFNNDGTKLYLHGCYTGSANTYNHHEFDLSTPYDISTKTLRASKTGMDTANQIYRPYGWGYNGDYLWVPVGDGIRTWTVSTPWDITTMPSNGSTSTSTINLYTGIHPSYPGPTLTTMGIDWVPGGNEAIIYSTEHKGYTSGDQVDGILKISVSTPYDLTSTKSLVQSADYDLGGTINPIGNITIRHSQAGGKNIYDGGRTLIVCENNDTNPRFFVYHMETPYDLSTLKYQGVTSTFTDNTDDFMGVGAGSAYNSLSFDGGLFLSPNRQIAYLNPYFSTPSVTTGVNGRYIYIWKIGHPNIVEFLDSNAENTMIRYSATNTSNFGFIDSDKSLYAKLISVSGGASYIRPTFNEIG